MIEYNSSPIKWCEKEFEYSIYIVEFWNTISSLSFTLIALYTYYDNLKRKVSFANNKKIKLLLFLMSLIGPTSFFFHATLNFYAQFLDEVSIIIFIFFCMKEVLIFSNFLLYNIVLISTLISWYFPNLSPFILLTTGTILTINTRKAANKNKDSLEIWNRGYYYGIFSIILWITDFICIINTHSFWHVFITISIYHFNLVIIKERICNKNKIKIVNNFIPYLEDY